MNTWRVTVSGDRAVPVSFDIEAPSELDAIREARVEANAKQGATTVVALIRKGKSNGQ